MMSKTRVWRNRAENCHGTNNKSEIKTIGNLVYQLVVSEF